MANPRPPSVAKFVSFNLILLIFCWISAHTEIVIIWGCFCLFRMDSDSTESADDRVEMPTATSKKNVGKAPRKIHKAAREKMKRANMNELFLDLGRTLDADVDNQNNGKASMLRETIRLIGELAAQMDSLKKENATLLSEYNYITTERDELLEETSALDSQVKGLQREVDERAQVSQQSTTQLPETAPVIAPVFVVPLHHDSQGFPFGDMDAPKVTSGVSKPQPRYPSSSDSWPSHILTK